MVFCIDPVGTVTACKMNVIPKIAIISVTVNDSRYSRNTDFGGPIGLASLAAMSLISFSSLLINAHTKYAGSNFSFRFLLLERFQRFAGGHHFRRFDRSAGSDHLFIAPCGLDLERAVVRHAL